MRPIPKRGIGAIANTAATLLQALPFHKTSTQIRDLALRIALRFDLILTMTFREAQTCSNALLIRPVNFGLNTQTAETNRFQRGSTEALAGSLQISARGEFDALVSALEQAGVQVHVFEDTPEPHTPDSIFPNNWVSFHADGSVVLYPMLAPNRRDERRSDVLEALSVRDGFRVSRVVDLTHYERDHKFLEGTGSLVVRKSDARRGPDSSVFRHSG